MSLALSSLSFSPLSSSQKVEVGLWKSRHLSFSIISQDKSKSRRDGQSDRQVWRRRKLVIFLVLLVFCSVFFVVVMGAIKVFFYADGFEPKSKYNPRDFTG